MFYTTVVHHRNKDCMQKSLSRSVLWITAKVKSRSSNFIEEIGAQIVQIWNLRST